MSSTLWNRCLCIGVLMSLLTAHQAPAMAIEPQYAPGQIIVKFTSQVTRAEVRQQQGLVHLGIPSLDRLLAEHRIDHVSQIFPHKASQLGQIYQLGFDAGKDPRQVAADFAQDEHVLYAEPRRIQQLQEMPNDEFYLAGIQWYIDKIQCPQAWNLTHGDSSVIIAIVDTGVDWDHPDLAANIWVNPGEDLNADGMFTIFDWNAVDDDGNGYVDDWCGWDFSGAGYPDNNPVEWGPVHGTHVAGCAAAVTNNGLGVAGVGWNCSIMAIKVTEDGEDGIEYGYEGILYAADNGADVINASWGHSGGAPHQFEQEIIDSANAKGAIIISSAGNDPGVSPPDTCSLEYPAWYDHVVAVAATDINDKATSWTFYGSWVDVAAPGSGIYNTWYNDSYALLGGTSMSSPIVAGIAGLLRTIDPDMTSDEFEDKMWHTSDDIYGINRRYMGWLGGGRANAYRAALSMTHPDIVLQGSSIDDSEGNGDGRPDPGEVVDWVISLSNTPAWQSAQDLGVKVFTDDSAITFIQDSVGFGQIDPGESGDNSANPFRFSISPDIATHWATFYLQMEATGAIDDMLDSLSMLIGRPPVLIVDDDGGDDLEKGYQRDLDGMVVLYDTWDVDASGKVDSGEMAKYDVLIWLTGAEEESTLTSDDRDHLASVLDAGGHLFLTGQNIGDEVGGDVFFSDYLHVAHLVNSVSLIPPYVDGAQGDVIAAGGSLWLGGSEAQNSPGGVQAIDPAMNLYVYRSFPEYAAAVRYESSTGSKIVYFAFGYEGIKDSDDYTSGPVVLRRIMEWFEVETGVAHGSNENDQPHRCILSQNYPNPFNVETRIDYIIPHGLAQQPTILGIYNILGQEVRTLVDELQGPGIHSARWDGRDRSGEPVSSGMYFCRLKSGRHSEVKKMVLLK